MVDDSVKNFSDMLVKARESHGISMYKMGLEMGLTSITLLRIERAENNYSVKKAFEYLSVIKQNVCAINNDGAEFLLKGEQECIQWIDKARGQCTLYQLAKMSGVSYSALVNVGKGKTSIRIDTFLKVSSALGYELKIC